MNRLTWLSADSPANAFPPVHAALNDPPGLVAAGGNLSVERLLAAYARGIFPWYSAGQPVLWWSPDPREVLFPREFHRSRSLLRRMNRKTYRVTANQDFAGVIDACRSAREPETWITPEMQQAYLALHAQGAAQSIEVWEGSILVGGLYGVRRGRVFAGESMFSLRPDASKMALAWLVDQSEALGVQLIDCQMPSAHLRRLGSRAIPRAVFLDYLNA
jgi:leucyl/phenylalanyl-tRNA---protein transferase